MGAVEGEENKQLPKVPKTKLFSDTKCPELFFFTYKINAIIINPNKDTQLAATVSKRFGRQVFTSQQPGLKPPQAATGVSERSSLLTQRNKGL